MDRTTQLMIITIECGEHKFLSKLLRKRHTDKESQKSENLPVRRRFELMTEHGLVKHDDIVDHLMRQDRWRMRENTDGAFTND